MDAACELNMGGEGEVGQSVPMAFMGSCLAGAIASSHAFFSFNVSVSSEVGCFRPVGCWALELRCCLVEELLDTLVDE